VTDVQKAQRIIPVPTLHFGEGALAGVRIRLDQDVATLGRGNDNDYVVADPRVSRVHAELHRRGDTIFVTDLGSSGGTAVNDETITGPHVLRHGDVVRFGALSATLEDPAADLGGDATMVFATPQVVTGPHLSPRQQEVLERIAEGMTNAEIGEQLGITERTVKAYAQELYDKLGVRNRAGAVAEAVKEGLLYGES
jgi:pSer/pThr/pTyr-binding forkhead associated (FHA) protein